MIHNKFFNILIAISILLAGLQIDNSMAQETVEPEEQSLVKLSDDFSATWRGRIPPLEAIISEQTDEITNEDTSSSSKAEKIRQKLVAKLCILDGSLNGRFRKGGIIEKKAGFILQVQPISETEANIVIQKTRNTNRETLSANLKLTENKKGRKILNVTLDDGRKFKMRGRLFRRCAIANGEDVPVFGKNTPTPEIADNIDVNDDDSSSTSGDDDSSTDDDSSSDANNSGTSTTAG